MSYIVVLIPNWDKLINIKQNYRISMLNKTIRFCRKKRDNKSFNYINGEFLKFKCNKRKLILLI